MVDFKIELIENVNNPKSIHGVYPYRGKISAKDAEQIVNQIPKGSVLLDPFCGSGTIVYEGMKQGLKSYGVELNPLAAIISKGKISIPQDKKDIKDEVQNIIENAKQSENYAKMSKNASKHFHIDTVDQISRVAYLFDDMSDYVRSAFFGAIALTARGCNHYKWTSSTVGKDINPKRFIDFYKKFMQKSLKHHFPTLNGSAEIIEGDARKLTEYLAPDSIDYVFTSPPYFDCLDYTAYYAKIIYQILGYERTKIKDDLIQNFSSYEEQMKLVLDEIFNVCKPGAKVIFVVGDRKVHGKHINGGEFFNSISPFKNVKFLERSYTKTSSQVFDKINKTKRKEQIVIWQK